MRTGGYTILLAQCKKHKVNGNSWLCANTIICVCVCVCVCVFDSNYYFIAVITMYHALYTSYYLDSVLEHAFYTHAFEYRVHVVKSPDFCSLGSKCLCISARLCLHHAASLSMARLLKRFHQTTSCLSAKTISSSAVM